MVTGTNMVQTNQLPAPSSVAMEATVATTAAKRISDNRRSNKPIMEKRRRARINNSLNELKTLILDAMKKDPARHSKLEKADILEMTVKHLQNLQRQQAAISAAADPSVISKFRAGFSECATEVGRFPGLDPIVKRRLLQHLANCLNQSPKDAPTATAQQQVQVHIVPNNANQMDLTQNNGIILSNGNGGGVQLLPTRLPNGDIALVLPTASPSSSSSSTTTTPSSSSPPQVVNNNINNNNSGTTSPSLPLLVPIPQRTLSTSTISDTSSTHSNYSPSHSPEPTESIYQPKPLSLVVRKVEPADVVAEEKPWRPW